MSPSLPGECLNSPRSIPIPLGITLALFSLFDFSDPCVWISVGYLHSGTSPTYLGFPLGISSYVVCMDVTPPILRGGSWLA